MSLVVGAGEANAREPSVADDDRATARKLAAEGSDAFAAGDFQRALELFNRASELVRAPTITLMRARAEAELGHLVAAAERYAAAQELAATESANAAFRAAAESARSELAVLTPRIPTLRVKLLGAGAPAATVTLDGRPVDRESLTEAMLLDPGSHTVEVSFAAGSSVRSVELAQGAREELVFNLDPPARVPVSAPAPAAEEPAEEPGPRGGAAAWVALGTGAAFTGAGVVVGIIALGHKADLDAACEQGCPPGYEGRVHGYRVERTLSYLGFALGAASVTTGLLLWRSGPSEAEMALAVSPGGVSLRGRFW